MILPGHDPEAITRAAERIRAGDLVGMPTETVYGLAADASNDAAVAKIFAAKGRPADHPLIVHVANPSQIADYAVKVPTFASRLVQVFWPGPLTVILPRKPHVGAAAAGGQDSIGLRCPSHPVAQALLNACATGLAAPSANRFGRVSPTQAVHVEEELGEALLILDGGPCEVGIESTIIDCTRARPVLLRPGMLSRDVLEAACGEPVLDPEDAAAHADVEGDAPRASGTLVSHYAPHAKVRLMAAGALQSALDILGPEAAHIAVYARAALRSAAAGLVIRRMPDDAAATAQQLFAVLRGFDAQGVKLIWIETPPEAPDWDGVRDRLVRAAAD
jgi:L-threonylcarbamoyladenylate synthase